MGRFEHVIYELVCSGLAIPTIYDYLRDGGHAPESMQLASELAKAADRTPLIVQAALNQNDALSAATLDLFVRILGAEAGNMALKVFATGGTYLGGGIPPRILPLLQGPAFLEAFRAKGRLSDLLAHIPVNV